jgi:type IV pilus assembly protein PilC
MPEKQAKEFAQSGGQAFELDKKTGKPTDAATEAEKKLVLNIVEVPGKKILLKKKPGEVKMTGNPIIDAYNKINDFVIESQKIKVKDKAVFFRLLAVMLNAGLPLIRSLDTLAIQSEKTPKLGKILTAMARSIERGKSLSEAMEEYTNVFGDAEIGVVRAGEAGGQLNNTLQSLAKDLEKTASITGKIKGAMIYPVVILSLLVVAMFLIMIMVIPQITKLFAEAGQNLPLPTLILMTVSEFSVKYWPVVVIGVIGFAIGFGAWKKTRTGRYIVDYIKIKLPVFGPVFQKGALSKFSRGFADLLSAGVPIIKSIEILARSVGNEVYNRRLLLTAEALKRGIPMAENMAESPLFPAMLVNMIEVGEQTAQLENVSEKVADFYDEEIDTVVAALSKIMEPMILVIIGVSVGGLVAAIMLPIMQLTEAAGTF